MFYHVHLEHYNNFNRWDILATSRYLRRQRRVTLEMWRATTPEWTQKAPSTPPHAASAPPCRCWKMDYHQVSGTALLHVNPFTCWGPLANLITALWSDGSILCRPSHSGIFLFTLLSYSSSSFKIPLYIIHIV